MGGMYESLVRYHRTYIQESGFLRDYLQRLGRTLPTSQRLAFHP